ncbi:MAG: hypothetical protein NTY77_04725 [Elusimicrobia bacterium]|nr:hypothetical protein [Elusimicrobiota bacterium]
MTLLFALAACSCAPWPGINGMAGLRGEAVSRALAVLPKDRGQAGTLSFRIETGPHAGLHRCEVLGRGLTSPEPKPDWVKTRIGKAVVYYAPMDVPDGATVPGVYDLRNITPQQYEIELLDKPESKDQDIVDRIKSPDSKPKPYYSGVFKHWYSRRNLAAPIDLIWSEAYQAGSQGEGRPVFERRPEPSAPESAARLAKQLARAPDYYRGPYGRSGFAIHTDQWEDRDRLFDPAYAGKPEVKDFRFRDTNGCLKVRPACLELLDEFVSEQAGKGRRVQVEVREE